MTQSVPLEAAEAIVADVTSVTGVAGMHSGQFGEVALLYPGTRVQGLRLTDSRLEVHLVCDYAAGEDLYRVAEKVRAAASQHVDLPVDVIFGDAQ